MSLELGSELRYAFRSLRRQPAVSLTVVFTIGFATALNAALFAIFDGPMFLPLVCKDVDRLAPPSSLGDPLGARDRILLVERFRTLLREA